MSRTYVLGRILSFAPLNFVDLYISTPHLIGGDGESARRLVLRGAEGGDDGVPPLRPRDDATTRPGNEAR